MSTWQDRRYFTSDVQAQTISSLIQKSILLASEQIKIEDDLIQLGDLSDSNVDLYETILARTYSNLQVWKLPLEPDNSRCRLWLHATNSAVLRDLSDFGGSGIFYGGIPMLYPGYDDGVTGNIQNPTLNGSSHFIKVPDSGNIQIKSAVATQTGISFFFRALSTAIQSADGTNVYLFSKVDDDLVTYAYQSWYDNGGVLHFQVIQNGVTYSQKTNSPVIAYVNDFSDFHVEDFKSADFYSIVVSPSHPSEELVEEFVFTYNFSSHAMQIYKNGVLLTLVSDASAMQTPPALTPPAIGSATQLTTTMTASGGTAASLANDNNISTTRWEQTTGTMPMFLLADCGQIVTLIYVEIAWYGAAAGRIYNFNIQVSDDNVTYATVYTGVGQGTDAIQRYEFPDLTGRYVKLNITGCSAGATASVWEFDVWGYLPITSVLPIVNDYNVPVTGGDYFDLYQAAQSSSQDPIFGVTGASSTDQKLMVNAGTTNVYSNGSGQGNFALSAATVGGLVYNPTISNTSTSVTTGAGGSFSQYWWVGAVCANTSSVLYGKVITQVAVKIARQGTFTGAGALQLSVKLIDNTGGYIAQSNIIDPNTVSTSYTTYTFNCTGWRATAVGDRVVLDVSGNYWVSGVLMKVLIGNPPDGGTSDGTNTYLYVMDYSQNWGTVGVGTGADPIYGITVSTAPVNHIIAEYVVDTTSVLYNKAITVFTPKMKKSGSPTGTIFARIRKSGGATIAADNSFSAASLTTSYVAYAFTFNNNTYVMAVNDQVEIQFDGGDPANVVLVQFSQTGLGDTDYDATGGEHSALKYQDTGSNWFSDSTSDMTATMAIANAPMPIAIGEYVPDNTSQIFGKIITKLTAKLAKTGAPTGSIVAYVRQASGTTVQSPTTINITTLPVSNGTNYVATDFDFSNNAHAMAVGDRIYVYYNGGDPSNYLVVQREVGSASGDTVHTIKTLQYPDTSFTQDTTDDMAGTLYATTVIPATTTNRVAMYLQGDFATMINHQPNDFTFYLKKLGAPTGTISFVIRDKNDAVVQTLGTYNAASLVTTGNTSVNFKNIVSFTHLMAKGDRISIEYTGGTTNDRVKVQQNSKSYYANPDTVQTWYNNTTWALVNDRVIAAIINEGGQTVTQQYLDINAATPPTISGYTHALYLGALAEYDQGAQNWVLRQGFWAGVFAEFRIYYPVLSQTEITNLFTNKRTIASRAYGEVLAVPNFMKLET